MRWFDKIRNVTISSRTGLPSIGDMLHDRRHSLFGHVVCMDPLSLANQALILCRDISMNRRLPAEWKRPHGRPRHTWVGQVRKDGGIPISTVWTRAMNQRLWGRGRDGLKGSAD